MKIDLKKKYRTRDGREVRLYAVDSHSLNEAVHGAIKKGIGTWAVNSWYLDGSDRYCPTNDRDLVEVKKEYWVHEYKDHSIVSPHPIRTYTPPDFIRQFKVVEVD